MTRNLRRWSGSRERRPRRSLAPSHPTGCAGESSLPSLDPPPAGGAGADDAWRPVVLTNQSGTYASTAEDAIQGTRLAVQDVK